MKNDIVMGGRERKIERELDRFGVWTFYFLAFSRHTQKKSSERSKKKKLKKIWRKRPIPFRKMCSFMQYSLRSAWAESFAIVAAHGRPLWHSPQSLSLTIFATIFHTLSSDSPSRSNLITFSQPFDRLLSSPHSHSNVSCYWICRLNRSIANYIH